jgi:hypothetical protein
MDLVVLPLGCIAGGLLASAGVVLRRFPAAGVVINALLPLKIWIGAAALAASTLSLLLPASGPPILGSFFPAAAGLCVGALLCLELIAGSRSIRNKERLVWIGNTLLYLKNPLGLASILFGFLHFFFHRALLF